MLNNTSVGPVLYKRTEAAIRLNISVRTLDTLLATKELPSVKIGKRRLVSEDAIQAFIKKAERSKR